MIIALAFLLGAGAAVLVNRVRWAIFPLSGGPQILSLLGQPKDFDNHCDLLTQPCPKCGRPPFGFAKDLS